GDQDDGEDGAEPEDRPRLPALGVAVRSPARPLLLRVGPVAILVFWAAGVVDDPLPPVVGAGRIVTVSAGVDAVRPARSTEELLRTGLVRPAAPAERGRRAGRDVSSARTAGGDDRLPLLRAVGAVGARF